jgi:DNA-binding transcriptional ArsR family regulator
MRLAELDRARLDRLARARGLSRSELVRALLAEAEGAPAARPSAPTRLEALELLADKARSGSVPAAIALERALRLGGEPAVLAPAKTGPVRLEELTADELAG